MFLHLRLRPDPDDPTSTDVFVVYNQGSSEKKHDYLTEIFSFEEMRQNEFSDFELNNTPVYLQRLPKDSTKQEFIVEYEELKIKYVLLHVNGVSQWYFDNSPNPDEFAGLPHNSQIIRHLFFSENLVPVTTKTRREIVALYDAARLGRPCKDKPPHDHLAFHIYLKLDLAMYGPEGAETKYMTLTVCDYTKLVDLFLGAGGLAAVKDYHLLRQFSWGKPNPEIGHSVLVTGVPFCYGTVKGTTLTVSDCGWEPDGRIMWMYPCKLK